MENITHPLTLTVEQAAKILGIGRSTAYELVHTGEIPSLRLGRRIVVPVAKLAGNLGSRLEDMIGSARSPGSDDESEATSRSFDSNPHHRNAETAHGTLF